MRYSIFYSSQFSFSLSLRLGFNCSRSMLSRFRNGAGASAAGAICLNHSKSRCLTNITCGFLGTFFSLSLGVLLMRFCMCYDCLFFLFEGKLCPLLRTPIPFFLNKKNLRLPVLLGFASQLMFKVHLGHCYLRMVCSHGI